MPLFLKTLLLLLGVIATGLYGNKGVLINLFFLSGIIVSASITNFSVIEPAIAITVSVFAVVFALVLDKISKKLFDPFPLRELLMGGSSLGLLVGMLLAPVFAGGVLGSVIGFPLLRRYSRLGLKAILFTFAGWGIRTILVFLLNIWFLIRNI